MKKTLYILTFACLCAGVPSCKDDLMYKEPAVGLNFKLEDEYATTLFFTTPDKDSRTIAVKETNMRDWLLSVGNVEGDSSDVSWCKASKNSGIHIDVDDNFEIEPRYARVRVLSPDGDELRRRTVVQAEQQPIMRLTSNIVQLDSSGKKVTYFLTANVPHISQITSDYNDTTTVRFTQPAAPFYASKLVGQRHAWEIGARVYTGYSELRDSMLLWSEMVKNKDTQARALKVYIVQSGKTPVVTISPTIINGGNSLPVEGATQTFTYSSTIPLRLQSPDSLFVKFPQPNPDSGSGTFTVVVDTNYLDVRTGRFQVVSGVPSVFKPIEVRFTQQGNTFDATTQVKLDANDLFTNAQSSKEGDIGYLVDDKSDTYFHSAYDSEGPADGAPHYIRVQLPNELHDSPYFAFEYQVRNNNSNSTPTEILVESSYNENGPWRPLKTLEQSKDKLPVGVGETSPKFILYKENDRYIRLTALKTKNNAKNNYGSVFFYLAELRIYKVEKSKNND